MISCVCCIAEQSGWYWLGRGWFRNRKGHAHLPRWGSWSCQITPSTELTRDFSTNMLLSAIKHLQRCRYLADPEAVKSATWWVSSATACGLAILWICSWAVMQIVVCSSPARYDLTGQICDREIFALQGNKMQ
ncbi:hypothetical protein BDV97DRAFT_221157 [Delphinella strobiligena]|nr:hypothetical protein BDV97DRAFT_221157 [Delphinella strobiligena]